eukprot:GAHX01006228.1.p1 GENE.GAHX01006228.1~~GAHX01006228.1.p1  ORF type:complete len:78 (+),score=12.96 GAHX01006228.1:330-563(+)
MLQRVLQEKYPKTTEFRWYNEIRNLRQANFNTIEEYTQAISEVVKRLKVCRSMTRATKNSSYKIALLALIKSSFDIK